MNKNYDELAVDLVKSWLLNEAEVSHEVGRTSSKGESKSVKEIAQAYLDFSHTIINGELPDHLVNEVHTEDEE